MRIRLTEDALDDLNEGFWFYEIQGSGLGDYFASSVRAEIESLKIFAGIHRKDYGQYHRLVCRVFPYAVYYTIQSGEAVIWAVVDCRRDPDWIRERLDP